MKPLSERMRKPFEGADVSPLGLVERWWYRNILKWADEVAQLESSLAEAERIANEEHAQSAHIAMRNGELETELAEARRENEKLRDTIEEALEYRGPEWASILRYALKGDDDG